MIDGLDRHLCHYLDYDSYVCVCFQCHCVCHLWCDRPQPGRISSAPQNSLRQKFYSTNRLEKRTCDAHDDGDGDADVDVDVDADVNVDVDVDIDVDIDVDVDVDVDGDIDGDVIYF